MTDAERLKLIRDGILELLREMDATRRLGGTHPLAKQMSAEHNLDVDSLLPAMIRGLEEGRWD